MGHSSKVNIQGVPAGLLEARRATGLLALAEFFFAYNNVMTELQALHTDLEIDIERHITAQEVEVDSTKVIELFHYAHPTYQSNMESCRSLLGRF